MARVVGILTFFLLWQGVVVLFRVPEFFLPSPWAVGVMFAKRWELLVAETLPTLLEIFFGFILGGILGMVFAILLAWRAWLRRCFLPVLIASQALPTFVLAPIFVLWFGYGLMSKVAMVVLVVFFPVANALGDGLRRTPKAMERMRDVVGGKRFRFLWHVQIPYALPSLGHGMKFAATYAAIGAVVGEWVGSSKGLGHLMLLANARLDTPLLFAALCVTVVVTLSLYFGVDLFFKRLLWWSK